MRQLLAVVILKQCGEQYNQGIFFILPYSQLNERSADFLWFHGINERFEIFK